METTTSDISKSLETAWLKFIQEQDPSESRTEPQKNIYASGFHPCARNLYLHLEHSHELPDYPPEVKAKFRRGKDRERDIRQDLERVGRLSDPPFEVIGQQERFVLKDRQGKRTLISGKIDGKIRYNRDLVLPFEIKSWAPQLVARVERFTDLFENQWTRGGAHQILAYLYGSGCSQGLMILDRGGLPLSLLVDLWKDDNHIRLANFEHLAQIAMDSKEKGKPPEFTRELSLCPKCKWFGSFCNPPTLASSGATVFSGEEFAELAAEVDEHEKLKAAASRYERLHKSISQTLRGVETGIIGDYLIEGKYSANTKTVWPDEATKRKYQVTEPRGKFAVRFTKIGGESQSENEEE